MRALANIVIPGHHFGAVTERSDAAEAFVMFTLGVLFAVLLLFAIAGWVLWRRFKHPEPHRQLLMEMEAEQEAEKAKAGDSDDAADPQSWEREADWWKKP